MKKLDWTHSIAYTVKLGDKERFDKEQIVQSDQLSIYLRNIWR